MHLMPASLPVPWLLLLLLLQLLRVASALLHRCPPRLSSKRLRSGWQRSKDSTEAGSRSQMGGRQLEHAWLLCVCVCVCVTERAQALEGPPTAPRHAVEAASLTRLTEERGVCLAHTAGRLPSSPLPKRYATAAGHQRRAGHRSKTVVCSHRSRLHCSTGIQK